MYRNRGLRGREALVAELAQRTAVHRVAPSRTKVLEVEQTRPMTNLLVGHEGDLEARMRQRGILLNARQKGADFGHACFVIRREQRGTVRAHDVFAHELLQVGDLFGRCLHDRAIHDASHQRAALVVHHMRRNTFGRGVGRGVKVSAQAKCR